VGKLALDHFPGEPIEIIGKRSYEKTNENLVSSEESDRLRDCGDVYVLLPEHARWEPGPYGADGAKVEVGFEYILDTENINRPQWWKDKCEPWNIPLDWSVALDSAARHYNADLLFSVFTACKAALCVGTGGHVKIASSEISNQALHHEINRHCPQNYNYGDNLTKVYMSVPPDKHPALIPALTWLNNCSVTLMHCVPEYPAEKPQLDAITELLKLGLPVGWSSHVAYPQAVDAARQAVDLGATIIEAHLRDFSTPENAPDNGPWSLYPGEFAELVREVKR